jgi:hypothetical protein
MSRFVDNGGQAPAERFDTRLCTARLIAECRDEPLYVVGWLAGDCGGTAVYQHFYWYESDPVAVGRLGEP